MVLMILYTITKVPNPITDGRALPTSSIVIIRIL